MTATSETHFKGSAVVRDIILGMSDGLTVPFALAAGLSGAVSSSFLVLVAGVAELTAGSISMGLGGYLGAAATRTTTTRSGRASKGISARYRKPSARKSAKFWRAMAFGAKRWIT